MNTVMKVNKNELSIDKNTIKFNYDIRATRIFKEQIIVLLSIPFDVDETANIYAISWNCKILWRVEKREPNSCNLPFENIFLKDGLLTATDFYGRRYFINTANGSIERKDTVK